MQDYIYKDGFVYGRGASDMKGGVATMMLALKQLNKENIKLEGQVLFMGIGDEETGSSNGTLKLLDIISTDLIDRWMMSGETEEKVIAEIEEVINAVKEDGFTTKLKVVNKGWDPL